MLITTAPKNCLTCNKLIRGRTDKKFCDDYCRNTYNNQLNSAGNNTIRNINYALRKNRRILESLLPEHEKMIKVNLEKLSQEGFIFKYYTHAYCNSRGRFYYFCYDHGYLALEKNWYLIVKSSVRLKS
jgi:hypothetical protein